MQEINIAIIKATTNQFHVIPKEKHVRSECALVLTTPCFKLPSALPELLPFFPPPLIVQHSSWQCMAAGRGGKCSTLSGSCIGGWWKAPTGWWVLCTSIHAGISAQAALLQHLLASLGDLA
jgi:hypothetical protein